MTGTAAFITTDFSPGSIPPIPGGCAYYRCFLPMQAMRIEARLGLPAWTGEDGFGIQSDKNEALFGFDLVVMKLLMDRRLPNQMRMAQALGQKIIVDVDDFYDDLPESNLAHEATDPRLHKFANREHYREIILAADMVTVTTPFLLDYYSRIHPCVRMIRNGVLPDQFNVRKVRDRKPVLGWVGGVPWRGGDLETMREWLPGFLEKHDLMFHHAGHADMVPGSDRPVQPIWELTGIPRERITTSPLRVLDEYHLMFDFDIGLIPLNDIPFNHAKCLYNGTMISTNRGLLRADQVKPGDQVWTQNQQWRLVQATQSTPTRNGLLIQTKSGRRIKVTPEHRLWVNDQWMEARFIEVGHVMQSVPMEASEAGYVRVPWPTQARRTKQGQWADYKNSEDVASIQISERWGRIFGLFAGDGACAGKTQITISCDGLDQDLISLVMDDFQKIGLTPTTEKMSTFDGVLLRRRAVRVASSHLSKVLVDLGMAEWRENTTKAKRIVCVPDVIFRSPANVIAAFLSGLFEADGTVNESNVSMTTIHQEFAGQVQLLLAMLGIQSSVQYRKTTYVHNGEKKIGKGAYMISLRRASADVFAQKIGFLSERKRERLARLAAKPHSNAYQPMQWDDPVVSVIDCEIESPIDIQVDGEEFVADGLRSHNSHLKGLEYSASGIPFVASALPEYEYLAGCGVGRVAYDSDGWVQHLEALLDYRTRKRDARINLENVRRDHSIMARETEWQAVVSELLG